MASHNFLLRSQGDVALALLLGEATRGAGTESISRNGNPGHSTPSLPRLEMLRWQGFWFTSSSKGG